MGSSANCRVAFATLRREAPLPRRDPSIRVEIDSRAARDRLAIVYTLARAGVAFVWLYHGLVPKLLFMHADELATLADLGLSEASRRPALIAAGSGELAFGTFILLFWRARWPLWLTLLAMMFALAGIAISSPRYLYSAFNVVTLNIPTALLAAIALATIDSSPAATGQRK